MVRLGGVGGWLANYSPTPEDKGISLTSILGAVLVIGLVYVSVKLRLAQDDGFRARGSSNLEYANYQGWEYLSSDAELVDLFHTYPFGEGMNREATNVIRGQVRGRDFILFSYRRFSWLSLDSGRFYVVAVKAPGLIPTVRVDLRTVGAQLRNVFGADEVKVESKEFRRMWFVTAEDEKVVKLLFTPEMIERFLREDLDWVRTMTFESGYLVTAIQETLALPETEPPFDQMCDIVDLVPAFLSRWYPEERMKLN